jgi:hypothetical protein
MVYLRHKTHSYALQAEWRMEHEARLIVAAVRQDSRISREAEVNDGGLELILVTQDRGTRRVRYTVSEGVLRRQALDGQGRVSGSTDLARVGAFVPEVRSPRMIQLELTLRAQIGEVLRQRAVSVPLLVGGVS